MVGGILPCQVTSPGGKLVYRQIERDFQTSLQRTDSFPFSPLHSQTVLDKFLLEKLNLAKKLFLFLTILIQNNFIIHQWKHLHLTFMNKMSRGHAVSPVGRQ
jgi:hypothetical protein